MTDYYPYGMDMPGRSFMAEAYRYGYQGSERAPETSGGAGYTTYFRALDPRIGRWLSPDPKVFPWQSPYCSMDCNPVALVDPWGASTGGPGPKKNERTGLYGNGNNRPGRNNGQHNPSVLEVGIYINNRIQSEYGKSITLEQFRQLNVEINNFLAAMDDGLNYAMNSYYDGGTGAYVFDIQKFALPSSLRGAHQGDNLGLLNPVEPPRNGEWLQAAGTINSWTSYSFDAGLGARMGLEKICASEGLVNNRLANGGLAGRYQVLRESAGYMQKFRTVQKYGGRVFFWTGTVFSVVDGTIGYLDGDNDRAYMATVDIVISSVLFASGVGIVGIPIYYSAKWVLSPKAPIVRPFNPKDLYTPYYHEPDNLRIEKPMLRL